MMGSKSLREFLDSLRKIPEKRKHKFITMLMDARDISSIIEKKKRNKTE